LIAGTGILGIGRPIDITWLINMVLVRIQFVQPVVGPGPLRLVANGYAHTILLLGCYRPIIGWLIVDFTIYDRRHMRQPHADHGFFGVKGGFH